MAYSWLKCRTCHFWKTRKIFSVEKILLFLNKKALTSSMMISVRYLLSMSIFDIFGTFLVSPILSGYRNFFYPKTFIVPSQIYLRELKF